MRLGPEDSLQATVVDFLRRALPPPCLVYSVPNGGNLSRTQAALFKRTGLLAGVHDLVILAPGRFGTLELKAGRNKLTAEQLAFGETVLACGWAWYEVRTVEEARDAAAAIIAPLELRAVRL